MKLLKIVLIALVTVVIYSFTSLQETQEDITTNVLSVDQYDGCITIVFQKSTTIDQMKSARKWINWHYSIQMVNLNERTTTFNGRVQEKWDYVNNRTIGDRTEDDDDKEEDWKTANQFLESHFLSCGIPLTHNLD